MRCIWSGLSPARPLIGHWRPSSGSDWLTQVQDKTMETLEMDGHWWHHSWPWRHRVNICVTCISLHPVWPHMQVSRTLYLLTRIKRLVNIFPEYQMLRVPGDSLPLMSIICLCSDLMFSWQYCVSASVTWYYCDNIYCGLAALCCGLCVVWSKLIQPQLPETAL